jgi:hypothetical protein
MCRRRRDQDDRHVGVFERAALRDRRDDIEGFDPAVVERVAAMIDRAEYKRRQAAPRVKTTPKAFGGDRRLPIINRYRTIRPPLPRS